MASIKKYDEKSKEKLAPLKAALVESKELEKTKVKKAEAAKDKYTLSGSDAELIKEKKRTLVSKAKSSTDYKNIVVLEELAELIKEKERTLVSKAKSSTDYKNIVVLEELASKGEIRQETLTKLDIHQPVETISIDDIKAILERREVIAAVKIVNFDLNYNIEIIPTPDINKIYSLGIVEKNVMDIPVFGKNVDTNELEESHVLKNFIKQVGGTYNLVVSGVVDTSFEVVVFDETNNTYYNWNSVSKIERHANGVEYVNTIAGSFQHGVGYYQGVIPPLGREVISIHIPTVTKETVYRLGFYQDERRKSNTDYGSLPMLGDNTKPLRKITQLIRSSTTIKFEDNYLSSGTGDLVVNHTPGSNLNSSNIIAGKYNIELKIQPRKQISLISDIVRKENLAIDAGGTEVLDLDLTASIVENIGIVKGTITLGKSSLRPCEIQVRSLDIFSTN